MSIYFFLIPPQIIIMLWFVLSLLTAIFEATKDAVSKKGLEQIDEYIVA